MAQQRNKRRKNRHTAGTSHRQMYLITLAVFAAFVMLMFLIKEFSGATMVTGNAIMETGTLNPGSVLGILILVSLYALAVCSYLGWKHKTGKKAR